MKRHTVAILVLFIVDSTMALEFVNRTEWDARPPKYIEYMNKPVPFVIIHHTYIPAACSSSQKCIEAMQSIQRDHQDTQGWEDIGYSFVIGGDGKIYEGRGFDIVGTHAPNYNRRSIGICLIGDWQVSVPPQNMLKATQDLITYAVERGHLTTDYVLYGHRQVTPTECPGITLFNEIQKWPHWRSIK